MLWVIFTDKILPSDKAGIIILMVLSMLMNLFIVWLVDCRCKNKQRQNIQFGGKQYIQQPVQTPKHTSYSQANIRRNTGVVINNNNTTVIITGNNSNVKIGR